MHLRGPDTNGPSEREHLDTISDFDTAAPESSGNDRSCARNAEAAIHRESDKIPSVSLSDRIRPSQDLCLQRVQALTRGRTHRENRPVRVAKHGLQLFPNGLLRHVDPLRLRPIDTREGDDSVLDSEQVGDCQVLAGLRHRPFVSRHDQEEQIEARGSGKHVLHEIFMARDINHPDLEFLTQVQASETKIDREAPLFLLSPPIRVCPGKSLNQGRLSVVHVTRRAQNERLHDSSPVER